MKITCTSKTDDEFREKFKIKLESNEKTQELSFCDGEPEDNSIGRNFNDIYSIPQLIVLAYNAGVNGEPIELIDINKENE